jgi:hypothetical protein
VEVPGHPNQRVLLTHGEVIKAEFRRAPDGSLMSSEIKRWKRPQKINSTIGIPWMMLNGQLLVFPMDFNLAWLNLETGDSGVWDTANLGSRFFSKISEDELVFLTFPGELGGDRAEAQILNLRTLTLGSALAAENIRRHHLSMPLAPRNGMAVVSGGTVSITSGFAVQQPRSLDELLTQASLDLELRRIQTQDSKQRISQRAYAEAMQPHALAGELFEKSQVVAFGVYRGKKTPEAEALGKEFSEVKISIKSGNGPIILALASNDPVRWNIVNASQRTIAAILIAGNINSTVAGLENRLQLRISAEAPYSYRSNEYLRLSSLVAKYAPNPIRSFQGAYSAAEFIVPDLDGR